MIIFDLNTSPRCGFKISILRARNDMRLEKALEKVREIRLNCIQNETRHGNPYLSPWNHSLLQLQIRLNVHHLCSSVCDTTYPNLRNRTLPNKVLSEMECKK
mmetsp:Transcript_8945/g.11553  ORF Transcript_8945/g.11553 Transcript_8945/m.11553 type:complete len:102 (-) Transcript_8945:195-500(-)